MLKLLQLSSHQNALPSQLTLHHKTGGNAPCGFNAKQLLHSSTPSGLLLAPRTALLQGLPPVRGLRRPAMNTSPHTPGRPEPKHTIPSASVPGQVRSGSPRRAPGLVEHTTPLPSHLKTCSSPSLPSGRPAELGTDKPLPAAGPAAARPLPAVGAAFPGGKRGPTGPWGEGKPPLRSAHRHQELQRSHVVPLGLEQLVEDADAQAKLLLQVLPAFPLAFPFAFLGHGAAMGSGAPSPAPFPAAGSAARTPRHCAADNKRPR